MSDLRERISRGDILIMDGGVNTEIERKGDSMRKMSRIVARRRQAIVRIPEKLSGVHRKNQGSCWRGSNGWAKIHYPDRCVVWLNGDVGSHHSTSRAHKS